MPTNQFAYQACDTQGKTHNGQLSAETEQEAVAILQARRLVPVQIDKVSAGKGDIGLLHRKSMSGEDLSDFTHGLCTLVETHVPLDRALALLEGLTEKPGMQKLIADLLREVKEGRSLADALQMHPDVFSRMYVNMVHAGEEGGILDKLLPRLERFLTEANEAKRSVISAMIYPIILAVVGTLSVILLLIVVVPQFAGLFEDMGPAIPASAAFLLNLSQWLKTYGWGLFFLPLVVWYAWRYAGATPERRLQRDTSLLSMPLLGSLLLESESSRFCRTLGALLGSGIPLLKGLHISRGVMENQVLENSVEQVEEMVRSGVSLGKALVNTGKFPRLLSQLLIVGEESGRTVPILDKLAETFNLHVKQQTTRLVTLLEPLLILILGVVVGAIVIIMLSAIFSINEMQF